MSTTNENTTTPNDDEAAVDNDSPPMKIRVLVISMGGARRHAITQMLQDVGGFAPPVFSEGIPSRTLRNRTRCLQACREVGLIPDEEWTCLQPLLTSAPQNPGVTDHHLHATCNNNNDSTDHNPPPLPENTDLLEYFSNFTVTPGRRGSPADVALPYSVELWRKAKTVNRGRAVLACALAHLKAWKTFTSDNEHDGFDVLLEDNVRTPLDERAAQRIRDTIRARKRYEQHHQHHHPHAHKANNNNNNDRVVHLCYFGWLGSTLNLHWNLQSYLPQHRFDKEEEEDDDGKNCRLPSVAPIPTAQHIADDLQNGRYTVPESLLRNNSCSNRHVQPGGTPVWGAYAYWLSREAYEAVLQTLQRDVGALLWKPQRARYYTVKPIDKILPRHVVAAHGPQSVVLATHPVFFRAPLLTSQIHKQWDAAFCASTAVQLEATDLTWKDLWLTDDEAKVVEHYHKTGEWASSP